MQAFVLKEVCLVIVDLVSQMKTVNLLLNFIQGNLNRCSPYPFVPWTQPVLPDTSLYGLPVSTPEGQGVESAWLNGFFCKLRDCKTIHVHSVAVLRHGHLIAAGSFKPYTAAYPHMLFSLSKSVTGMAVGMAVGEGRLKITDKLVDFFPEQSALFRNANLASVTIEHLLNMTAGVKYNEVFSVTDRDWVHGFLSSECAFRPGTDFYYNSMNSYMLAAVLRKLTGESLVDYLMPRLFGPLRIPRPRWETCPMGIEKGGWGLYLRTVDMAKLGQLYLQKGRWVCKDGPRQLVPAQWVYDSTHNWVPTNKQDRDDGYGYQLWNFPVPGAYQFNGVFGQYVVVLPHLDAVVAVTSGSQNFVSDDGSAIIAEYFAEGAAGFHDEPLAPNLHALRKLKDTTAHLYSLPEMAPPPPQQRKPLDFLPWRRRPEPPALPPLPPEADELEGLRFVLADNEFGALMPLILGAFTNNTPPVLRAVSFSFSPGMCHLTFEDSKGGVTQLNAGLGPECEACRADLVICEEAYPTGAWAKLTHDEDDRPVLKLFLFYLQTPCVRLLKFIFYKDCTRMLLRFDELPDVSESTDMFFQLVSGGGSNTLQKLFADVIAQRKLRGRIDSITMPVVHGTRAEPVAQDRPRS